MTPSQGIAIRCRLAACRENLGDGQTFSFYLINDSDATLDMAALCEISSEWGDLGHVTTAEVRVSDLQSGACALLWRDDGELRTELSVLVQASGSVLRLRFEFPRLYRQRDLPLVAGIGKPGCEGTIVHTLLAAKGVAHDCTSGGFAADG